MLPEFEKMSDNVNEVKANGKTVTYNKRSKGNFHDLLFLQDTHWWHMPFRNSQNFL